MDYTDSAIDIAVTEALTSTEGATETALQGLAAGEGEGLDGLISVFTGEEVESAGGPSLAAVGAFDDSSRSVQDTLIAESQEALATTIAAAEDAVAAVTGLGGRIATLETRKAQYEDALGAELAAQTAFNEVEGGFLANNQESTDNAGAGLVGESYFVDGADSSTDVLVATRQADGSWEAESAFADDIGIDSLLSSLQAQFDAEAAAETAQGLFESAVRRVIRAEQENEQLTFASGVVEDFYTENSADDDGVFTIDLDLGTGIEIADETNAVTVGGTEPAAPITQAAFELNALSEAFETAVANLTEARELVDARDGLQTAIDDARDVLEEDFDLALQDLNADTDDLDGTSDNDLFLFSHSDTDGDDPAEYTVSELGEQGQDHIFFGDTSYLLVELMEGQDLVTDRLGAADQLEVFWTQNGANLELFVEMDAAAGTDRAVNDSNFTKVVLTEFNAEDVFAFENGLLSTAPVEVA